MIGSPLAGDRMLLVDIISARASSWASRVSGTWTAIWSPSKSALYAAQTSGCSWMALPSISTGSKAWIQIGEHTSELQSRRDLVCRLLLEKKKKKKNKK